MNISALMDFPLGQACGAVGHDNFFKTDKDAIDSIRTLTELVKSSGAEAMLAQEYPDTGSKNIIVNIIDNKPYVIDGNRHCVSLLLVDPDLTFGGLENLRPGILRVWHAGVEEGRNSPDNPYDVYIPASVDISAIPGARQGIDYFKNPPDVTNIVPGTFPADSVLLPESDRGRPLGQTAAALSEIIYQNKASQPLYDYHSGSSGYGGASVILPYPTDGGCIYIDKIKGHLISSDENYRGHLSLPSVFCGNSIGLIGTDAFNRRSGLTGISFPASVTYIANAAFYGCNGLTAVTLPPRLEHLGDDAFGSCRGLLSVVFPDSPKKGINIGGGTFARCENLTSVTCLGRIHNIGSGAFYDCSKLAGITLSGGVDSIGSYAFSGCCSITGINLTADLQSIGEGAFERCINLRYVIFNGTKEQWDKISIGPGNEALCKADIHFIN